MNKDEPVDSIGGELLCVAGTFIHFICLVGSQMKTGQKIYNHFAVFFNCIFVTDEIFHDVQCIAFKSSRK